MTTPMQLCRHKIFTLVFLISMIFAAVACKNDIETIQALTSESTLPDVTGFQIEMSYTDSGLLKGKILAPEVLQYNKRDEPYYEFPKGMKAVFFDRQGNQTSFIQSNYAIYYYKKELWEGRNQVYGENLITGEKVETEQIFWDTKQKRVYSHKFSKITNADGVFMGEYGFEAQDDLTKLRMNGYSGRVTVTDEAGTDEGN